jgi:hypothetical protein
MIDADGNALKSDDDSEAATELFTFNPQTKLFKIGSDNVNHVAMHDLSVTATYDGKDFTYVAMLPITVTVDDPCSSAAVTIDPASLTENPVYYKIGYPANV